MNTHHWLPGMHSWPYFPAFLKFHDRGWFVPYFLGMHALAFPGMELVEIKQTIQHYVTDLMAGLSSTLNKTTMEKQSKNPGRRSVRAVPDGFHTVTPFLVAEQASELIRFIERSFGGKTTSMFKMDNGHVMHATVRIGDSEVMISDATEKYPADSSRLYLYVEDVDAVYKEALNNHGTSLREPADEFYGDRSCGIKDSWGNEWWIATHIEDVSNEEMEERSKKFREGVSA